MIFYMLGMLLIIFAKNFPIIFIEYEIEMDIINIGLQNKK